MNSGLCSFPAGPNGLVVTKKKENVQILAEKPHEGYEQPIINDLANVTEQGEVRCCLSDVESVRWARLQVEV